MNAMGGPVGNAPIPMMNNGAVLTHPSLAPSAAALRIDKTRINLNTYIYDYFIRNRMFDCARAIYSADPNSINVKAAPRRRDENGNAVGNGPGEDSLDPAVKDEMDAKVPDDLPVLNLPTEVENSFLLDWFCVFWEMYNAQRPGATGIVPQYVNHTQTQYRLKQHHQQDVLRQMRPDLLAAQPPYHFQTIRNMQQQNPAVMIRQPNLARTAMANNQNNPPTMQMMHGKPSMMQRDPSDMDGLRQRATSPGLSENAPSPSKRPRLEGAGFNSNQTAMVPNGRLPQGMQTQPNGPQNNGAGAHMLIAGNAINPASINPQFANFVGANAHPSRSIANYASNLQQHHGVQISNKQAANAGSQPQVTAGMMGQGPDSISAYYHPSEMNVNAMRGQGGPVAQSGNALHEYQTQLMMLEAQNKKRLMMARAETDVPNMSRDPSSSSGGPPGAPPNHGASVGGPNGQFSDGSPQVVRPGTSPSPSDQMKRGTPQLANTGIPSPLPEGAQSRDSPNTINFMNSQMDVNAQQHFFKNMEGNFMSMNGIRPGEHPGQQFANPMTAQMMAQRQIQQQQLAQAGLPGNVQTQWQSGGPNAAQMGSQQVLQGPIHGTPQQRSMPPPSAPAAMNNVNRTSTASPQQAPVAPPTPKTKAVNKKEHNRPKDKRQMKKASTLTAGATQPADLVSDLEAPAPATPMTPVNPGVFNKAGQVTNPVSQAAPNGPAGGPPSTAQPQPTPVVPGQHPEQNQGSSFGMDSAGEISCFPMEFAHPLNTTGNVLEDFDFDRFLHDNDGIDGGFAFDTGFNMEGANEIGASD